MLEFLYVVFKFIEKHCLEVFLVGPVYEIFFLGGGGGVKGKKKPFVSLNKPKHQKLIGCLLRSNFGNHVKFQK